MILEIQKLILNDPAFKQTKKQLHMFFDKKGILGVGGRINNTPLPFETKYPILLHSRHHLTYLLVYKCHSNVKHNGITETLIKL